MDVSYPGGTTRINVHFVHNTPLILDLDKMDKMDKLDKNGQKWTKTEIVWEHSQIIYGSTNTVFNNYILH